MGDGKLSFFSNETALALTLNTPSWITHADELNALLVFGATVFGGVGFGVAAFAGGVDWVAK